MPIELHHDAALHRRAYELAGLLHLPASYDSHYLALVERLDTTLYTADQRLLNSLQGQSSLRVVGLG